MFPDSAGIEPTISWTPVERTSDWATKAGCEDDTQMEQTLSDTIASCGSLETFKTRVANLN